MKQATIRDLHVHTGAIVNHAAEGAVITIIRRGVPVAQLQPLQSSPGATAFGPEHWARVAGFPRVPDSGRWLEKNR